MQVCLQEAAAQQLLLLWPNMLAMQASSRNMPA
jgi:hypothetical protein